MQQKLATQEAMLFSIYREDKMVSKSYAELHPEEHLGRDIFLGVTSDLAISSKNDLSQVRYSNNLVQAIINRLRTNLGELSLHPNYGCRLNELIGTNPNELTLSLAEMHVREALLQEPRVDEIISISPSFREGMLKTQIDIDIVVKPIYSETYLNLIYSVFV